MSELLAPPDVEPAVVAVLAGALSGVWVGTEYEDSDGAYAPSPSSAGSIRVSSTGGARPVSRVVVEQTVLVECWHDDEDKAWSLAQHAWGYLRAASGSTVAGVDIKHVSSTMPNNNPDANRLRMVRYQFMSTIHTRLVPLEAP